jgi:prepilin-type N-terminal cleavage/methylation domain-containing protein
MLISSASHSPEKMSNRKAFTLVEIMISVVILAIGLSAVLRSFLQCLNGIAASRNYVFSSSAAKAKMDDILAAAFQGNNTTFNITIGNTTAANITAGNVTNGPVAGGTEIMGGRAFDWQIALNASVPVENFTDVSVTYSWREGKRQPGLSCHMYIPQVKATAEQTK